MNALSVENLAFHTDFTTQKIEECLKTLIKHGVIKQSDNCYVYTVELMRSWVQKRFSTH